MMIIGLAASKPGRDVPALIQSVSPCQTSDMFLVLYRGKHDGYSIAPTITNSLGSRIHVSDRGVCLWLWTVH